MPDSIKNEKSRVYLKFLAWVYGSAMMGSTEQRMDSLEKMMNSILDTLNLIQCFISGRCSLGTWYTLRFYSQAYMGQVYNIGVIIKIYLIDDKENKRIYCT